MRRTAALAVMALVLGACGADGPPVAPIAPSAVAPAPGMTITGTVRTGIARDGG